MKLPPQSIQKFFKWSFVVLFCGGVIASLGMGVWLYQLNQELPKNLDQLHQPEYSMPTVIYDRHGNQVDEFFIQRRIPITYDQLPPHFIQALVASEDSHFFSHWGIDPLRMLKAFLINLKEQRFAQGASTITQQTARLFLLSQERKLVRKLKEILLAFRIESQFTKEEILVLYLNKVFFGNAEGVEAAAQGYFGKHARELTLAESATLVGVLPAPSRYSPRVSLEKAKHQRNLVLDRMHEEGFISEKERDQAISEEIKLSKVSDIASEAIAYYVEHARKYLIKKYGFDRLYTDGLQVHLAMDADSQVAAYEAFKRGVLALDQRQGFRGPLKQLKLTSGKPAETEIMAITRDNNMVIGGLVSGVVTQISAASVMVDLGTAKGSLDPAHLRSWKMEQLSGNNTKTYAAEVQVGDVITVKLMDFDQKRKQFRLRLHQEPLVNGALFSMMPDTGHVIAMVGGYSYDQSQFNRAIQAKRQPGSVFKPVVYAAAIDAGYTLASPLVDSPRQYVGGTKETDTPNGKVSQEVVWAPKNFGNKLLGRVSFKEALVKSLNLPTIGLVEELKPSTVIAYARKLGIEAEMENNLTIGLGSFSETLETMVRAFGVFANDGQLVEPIYILKVTDRYGKVLEKAKTSSSQVISTETAFLITEALHAVVSQGTARAALQIGRPSAGKTGTTNKNIDAWYIGYIPQLLTGVYVGFDQPRSIGRSETGGQAAVPIWADYMKQAASGFAAQGFRQPSGIVSVRLHQSGRRAVPCDPETETSYEKFKEGTEPVVDPNLMKNCEDLPTATATPEPVENTEL